MEVHRSQHVIRDGVVGIGLHEALQFAAGVAMPTVPFRNQGMQQTMVDKGVPQQHPALGTELVLFGRVTAASGASHWWSLLASGEALPASHRKDALRSGNSQRVWIPTGGHALARRSPAAQLCAFA